MGGSVVQYSNELCYGFEKDYKTDNDVMYILRNGITPLSLYEASKLVKRKEKSKLIKLPIDLNAESQALNENGAEYKKIDDLSQITDIIFSKGSLKMVLECIEAANNEDIMLKVQGPFSCLLSVVGSNNLFRWLYKYENEVKSALDKIVDGLAGYIVEALNRGVSIISFADPSGMTEVLGEKLYKKFVAAYSLKLLRKIEPMLKNSLVHLCPRTSIMLEKYGFISTEIIHHGRENYAEALIELCQNEDIKFVGHRCINAEQVKDDMVYVINIISW